MAPKEKKKAEPALPPSDWVAREASKEWMGCAEGAVTHLRAGKADAVRGKQLLANGHFRVTFEVTHTSSTDAQDMLIGVCDAAAWSSEESKAGVSAAGETLQKAFGHEGGAKWQTFGRHGHAVGWGFEPKTGRLVTTPDVSCGRFAGGMMGKALVANETDDAGRPMKWSFPRKSTVVLECNMLELDEARYEIQRRSFGSTLHPLQAGALRGHDAVAPPVKVTPQERRTLSVSVNGSPFIEAGVALPPAVFPWVMLTWQGDTVTMVACERFAPKVV